MSANTPYTQKQFAQFRGPQNSDEYNLNQENVFKDLSYLYNKLAQTDSDQDRAFAAFVKNLWNVHRAVQDLSSRLAFFEAGLPAGTLSLANSGFIDTDRFNATEYNVNTVDRCLFDTNTRTMILPKVDSSSVSKIRFANDDGTYNIPASLQTYVAPITTSVDNTSAVISTSQPYNAVINQPGKVWARNVITATADNDTGAQMYFYISIPNELSSVAETNCIQITPYPVLGLDILEIAYTTDVNLDLPTSTNWTVFNKDKIYYQNNQAIGKIMPGGWDGDAILYSGPKTFYFAPMALTGIRFKLRQRQFYSDGGKNVYSYGLSKLDIRYDKLLDTGKQIFAFNTAGMTQGVTSVTPQIWNIPEYDIPNVFSYRIIWETSFGSGVYTLTPTPGTGRFWVEVTLKKNVSGTTPVLSGLILKYT